MSYNISPSLIMTSILIERGKSGQRHTHTGRMPCEDEAEIYKPRKDG